MGWHYTQHGLRRGPVSEEKFRELAASGRITPDDLVWHESMSSWIPAADVPGLLGPLFFPVGQTKLALLSVCTFGIYQVYWFYRGWKWVHETRKETISPLLRAFLMIPFSYAFFRRVEQASLAHGIAPAFHAGVFAVVFAVLNLCWRLPDVLWIAGFLTFLPLLSVQGNINEINAKVAPNFDRNERISRRELVLVIVGGIVVVFLILDTLGIIVPPEGFITTSWFVT